MKDNNYNGFEEIDEWAFSQDEKKEKRGFFKNVFKVKEEMETHTSPEMEISEEYANDHERRMNEISDNQPYHNTGTYTMVPEFDEAEDEDGVVNASGS